MIDYKKLYEAERAGRIADRAYANARYSELRRAYRDLLAVVERKPHTARQRETVAAEPMPETEEEILAWIQKHPDQVQAKASS